MNLEYLFEIQAGLDAHIMEQHPELKGQNNLDWKILALQVELGECANEWRGFKKWSHNQNPNTEIENLCPNCSNGVYTDPWGNSETCEECQGENVLGIRNPLLEEYVDCLHFILSIGLELNIPDEWVVDNIITELIEKKPSIEEQFISFNQYLQIDLDAHDWFDILGLFYGLGEMLGFTWEQIETAYLEKNKVNHERQVKGY